jgi:diaminohydroxyphosphoribosylaminopyrimidine deaminase/5-amino-6-(5-phosphoribosylamino)uracil reductase
MAARKKSEDVGYMTRALVLAAQGEGRTRPNPPVGAVVVAGGRIVGEGWHKRAGAPHAEAVALRDAGTSARGATLYVTLEPCSTQGRTPPCTQAIIDAGISRVVVSRRDPNPKHRGRGLRQLRLAGITVKTRVCFDEGQVLLAPFEKWVTKGRPFVTLKMAMSLDGRIADCTGASRWISSNASRSHVGHMRRRSDAIMVGAETALADDPSLTWSDTKDCNPYRIVLDRRGRLPLESKLLSDELVAKSIIVVGPRCAATRIAAFERCGATVWKVALADGRLSLPAVLARCAEAGMLHLLSEGGGEVAASLIAQEFVDQIQMFIAPRWLGGGGVPVVGGTGWELSKAPRLEYQDVRRIGPDIWVTARPRGHR